MFTLLQLHWGDLPYFVHTRAINEEYCRRHGYQYEAREVNDDQPFRRLYHRAPEALQLLSPDNMVLYLDADACVVDLDRPLDDLVNLYFQDARTAAVFPENGFDSTRRWSSQQVNTGVFLLREHEASRPMMQAWWDAYEPAARQLREDMSDQQKYQLLNDQAVFNRVVLRHHAENINIVRNPELGGVDGQFVHHYMLHDAEERETRLARDRFRLLGA